MVLGDRMTLFLRQNRLAARLAMCAFPFTEILAMRHTLPLVMPVGEVVAIEVTAAGMIGLDVWGRWRGRGVDFGFPVAALLWLTLSGVVLTWLGVRAEGEAAFLSQFRIMLLPILAFAGLARMLAVRGPSYAMLFSSCLSVSCLFVGAVMAWSVLDTAVRLLPMVYDPVLYRIDFLLGLTPLYRLNDVLTAHRGWLAAVLVFYKYNLGFAVPVVFAEAFVTRREAAGLTLQLFVSSFVVFPLFCVLPAMAPAFFFGGLFPDHLPPAMGLAAHVVVGPAQTVRNTFPSLHAAWAILLVLAVLDGPVWMILAVTAYLVVTFVATIGFGEHYVVDWLGAMPLVLFVWGLCAAGVRWAAAARWQAVAVGAALEAAWLVVGRMAPGSLDWPGLLWLLAGLSVAVPVWAGWRLFRAERAWA